MQKTDLRHATDSINAELENIDVEQANEAANNYIAEANNQDAQTVLLYLGKRIKGRVDIMLMQLAETFNTPKEDTEGEEANVVAPRKRKR